MNPRAYTEGGSMLQTHASTLDLADQDVSVAPARAAYLHDLERRLAPFCERTAPR
jgi:hypothetical protein